MSSPTSLTVAAGSHGALYHRLIRTRSLSWLTTSRFVPVGTAPSGAWPALSSAGSRSCPRIAKRNGSRPEATMITPGGCTERSLKSQIAKRTADSRTGLSRSTLACPLRTFCQRLAESGGVLPLNRCDWFLGGGRERQAKFKLCSRARLACYYKGAAMGAHNLIGNCQA